MSKVAELNRDGHESVTNGSLEKQIGDAEPVEIEGEEGEESDDYEEIDEEERQIAEDGEDEEDEGEEAEKQGQNTLTHLLLGNTNGATAENEAEYEEDEEDADQGDEDEDDDDEYVEDDEEEDAAPPNPLTKKRSIDEVADEEASHGSKKIKA